MTRARGGQLDYVPQAFPGCRAPDGPAPGLEDELVRLGLAHKVPEVVRLALDQLFESIRARVPTATEAHVARFKHAHFAELAVGLEHLVRQALLPADSDRLEGTCACREGESVVFRILEKRLRIFPTLGETTAYSRTCPVPNTTYL